MATKYIITIFAMSYLQLVHIIAWVNYTIVHCNYTEKEHLYVNIYFGWIRTDNNVKYLLHRTTDFFIHNVWI
jgi:hypothetical protein